MTCYLGLVGCSTFGKKSQGASADPPPASGGSTDWASRPGGGGTQGYVERPPPAAVSGVLAGRVIESYDRNPPPAFIRVVPAGSSGPAEAPTEVATDAQGFFMIRGLQPGQHYQLIARTRDGPKLAGQVWATPPDARVLITMSEGLYTQATPPAPPPPEIPGPKPAPPPAQPAPSFPDGSAKDGAGNKPADGKPSQGSGVRGQGTGNTEQGNADSDANGQRRSETRLQDMASRGYANNPPTASVPPQAKSDRPVAQPMPAAEATLPAVPTRVPSCVLTGRQLENFALRDLNGQPWEYRTQHRGKLVLLDFWATWCLPCKAAISHLRILQHNHGRYGLEVIGIAYEYDAPFQEQVRKVQSVRDTWGINYQLLMGSDMMHCPVKTQFQVRAFPTLVLLDQDSRIIWRCDDPLTSERIQELEALIMQQLRQR
jgi:thiol-disulfide isomerase/thioredoxin